jgi:hypothetical protein
MDMIISKAFNAQSSKIVQFRALLALATATVALLATAKRIVSNYGL